MRRLPLLLVLAAVFILLPLAGEAVRLYTDWLWFHEVGYANVFGKVLTTKLLLGLAAGVVVFGLLYGNLRLTARGHGRDLTLLQNQTDEAPQLPQIPPWSMIEPIYRRVLLPGSLVLAFMIGAPIAGRWPEAIRLLNGVPFGVSDPLFGRDVGFYVFTYPLLVAAYQFLFFALAVTAVATAGVYVLARGIQLAPQRLVVHPWARAHLLGLAAALLLVKVWGYVLDRYALLFSAGGASFGASYADVHATLPVLGLVMGLAGLAAVLCLVQMARPGFRLALAGVGLWLAGSLLGLGAYPTLIQRLHVVPNEIVAERPYIERTIAATNRAYGLDAMEVRPFPAEEELTLAVLRKNDTTIKNIRLWEHRPLLDSYAQLQEIRTYYKFVDVDNDRYQLDGDQRQVMLSVRELSHAHLPSRIWMNEHLVYTHGYGAVVSPVNRVTREGLPEFFVKDIPPAGTTGLQVTRPEDLLRRGREPLCTRPHPEARAELSGGRPERLHQVRRSRRGGHRLLVAPADLRGPVRRGQDAPLAGAGAREPDPLPPRDRRAGPGHRPLPPPGPRPVPGHHAGREHRLAHRRLHRLRALPVLSADARGG